MALFTSNQKRLYKNIELARFLGRLLGYGLDLQTAMSEVRSFAHLLGHGKGRNSPTAIWAQISEDLREGFALSDALAKTGRILSSEDLDRLRMAEEKGTLPQALVKMVSIIEAPSCDETKRATYGYSEGATINMVNTVINDALQRKAERVGLSLKPLIVEQNKEFRDTNEKKLDGILSELRETEGASVHFSLLEAGQWQSYRQAPLAYFRPVINCILYRAGMPYWAQDDIQGSFQTLYNEEMVDISVNYYPTKKELCIGL